MNKGICELFEGVSVLNGVQFGEGVIDVCTTNESKDGSIIWEWLKF